MTTATPSTPAPAGQSTRLDRWLTRHGVLGVPRRDALLAGVLAVLTVVAVPVLLLGAARLDGPTVGVGTALGLTVLTVAQCLLLTSRRTRPVGCLLLVAAAQVAVALVTPAGLAVLGPAPLVAAYSVGSLPTRSALAAVAGAVGVELVAVALAAGGLGSGTGAVAAGVINVAVAQAGAALVGAWVATRRRYVDLVRRQAAEALAGEESRVRSAIAGERTRMARELHDIAAHHLSGMVVQATATARLVDRDPDAARAGLLAIRAQGRRTLEDLRMLVGVLRDPGAAEDVGPVPGLAMLDQLVEQARALGADVRVDVPVEPDPLGPLADVTAYRLVQESLSNARQHAPGSPVVIGLSPDSPGPGRQGRLVLTVTNSAPGAPGPVSPRSATGVGLLGMRERVQLLAGRLDAGPTLDGGWSVRAELPTEPTEPTDPVGSTEGGHSG